MASINTNVKGSGNRLYINPSHIVSTGNTENSKVIWASDIDWGDINTSLPNITNTKDLITIIEELFTALGIPESDTNTTYSAGTGLSLAGTTFNHSNSVTAKSSGLYKIAFDAQGHITSASAVTVDDLRALLDDVYEPKSSTVTKQNLTNFSVSMNGWTYGGTASNPSVNGNTGGGTVTYKYKVSTAADSTYTSTKPSNAGIYTVQATVAETTNYYGATATANFTIAKANINPTVSMSGWTEGQTASNPSVSGNTGNGTVTYQYKVSTAADSTYTLTKPSTAGTYTVKASIAATTNYNAGTATANFTISAAQQQTTYYWYVGTIMPSDPTNNAQNTDLNKWHNLGESLPTESIEVTMVDNNYENHPWYIAAPHDANFTLYNALNSSEDLGWNKSSINIGAVSYDLWTANNPSYQAAVYLHK